MRIPLAPYGKNEIILSCIILLVAGYFAYVIYPLLTLVPLVLIGFIFYFFRHPDRQVPDGDNLVLSPADGKVIDIAETPENEFIKTETVRVGIFLSVFNVHVNRSPCKGQVSYLDYKKGKYLVASHKDAPSQNERNTIGLAVKSGSAGYKILLRQIAGIIAQRIVCDCKLNDMLASGQPFGMIKFGSRTEIYIPKDRLQEFNIKLGDKVKGGETVIARLK